MSTQITSTRVSARTDTNVPFFSYTIEQQEYIKVTYRDTGKILSLDKVVSADGFLETIVIVWADVTALDDFNYDQLIEQYRSSRAPYNRANNITSYVQFG